MELDLPYRRASFDREKSILLVDGQQRTAALAHVSVDEVLSCPLPVCAIVATEEDAKEIFRVANKTVPIKTEFSRALAADLKGAGYVADETIPAQVCREVGALDSDSPFYELIRFPRVKGGGTRVVAYNTLFEVVREFYEDGTLDLKDSEDLRDVILRGFKLVKATWPKAWGVAPSGDAKLMHGAGLRAVADLLLFKLSAQVEAGKELEDAWEPVEKSFEKLKSVIAWTRAEGEAGNATIKANWGQIADRQNTNQDIRALKELLRAESRKADRAGA